MERKYIAFISYRHAELDSAVAKQLHTLIEQYAIPKKLRKNGKRLGIVFRDQEELPISSNLSDDICQALDNSQFLIVVCSKNTAHSPWVGREIDYFLSHHDQQHTLAVLASGEPQDVFPKALTIRRRADGTTEDVEPLAVDVRADSIPAMKKKLRQEIRRLYAALIGCPYDALVMREQKRKQRQLAAVMAIILTVLGSFTAMTMVKNFQIDQKNQELAGMNLTLEGKNQELEDKNDELARQKAQVQLRESELLTEKGLAAVAENDTQSALENLVAALPNSKEDRPYYAQAEQGLISALEFLEDDREPLKAFGATIDQPTPIAFFEISPDGSKIMTVDAYGLVNCYRVSDGSSLWTIRLEKKEYIENLQTLSYPQGNAVFIFLSDFIYAVDWDSGDTLWLHDAYTVTKMYLSPDGETLVYYGKSYTQDMDVTGTYLIALSPRTGEVIQAVETHSEAMGNSNPFYCSFPQDLAGDACENKAFSSDSRFFAYCFYEHDFDGVGGEYCVIVDLETGTSKEVFLCSRNGYGNGNLYQMFFTRDNTALLCLRTGDHYTTAFSAEVIDIATGKILWQSEPEPVSDKMFPDSYPVFAVLSETELFIGRGPMLYYLDIATGEILASYTLPSNVVLMEWVEEEVFAMALEDGRYTLVLGNSQGIHLLDYRFSTNVSFGACTKVQLWKHGPLRLREENQKVVGVNARSPQEGFGFAAVIPADNSHSIKIKRIVSFQNLVHAEILMDAPIGSDLLSHNLTHKDGKENIILRRSRYQLEDSSTSYEYFRYNLKTKAVETFETAGYTEAEELWFTSDGTGCIVTDSGWDLQYVDLRDGSSRVLFSHNPSSEEDYLYSGAILDQTGQALTAVLGLDTLCYWLDGGERIDVSVPEDLCIAAKIGEYTFGSMHAHSSGYLLCANLDPNQNGDIQSLAAYNVYQDKWYRFAGDWDSESMFVNLAENHSWAVYNVEGNVFQVADMTTGKVLYTIPVRLDPNSLETVMFTASDRYLLLQTMDRQVFVYDVKTGEQVGSYQMQDSVPGELCAQTDRNQNRIYLWYAGDLLCPGVCLDMESWTVLAEIPGMVHYDSSQDLIYCYHDLTRKWVKQVHAFRLPSTEELVAMGESLLAQ